MRQMIDIQVETETASLRTGIKRSYNVSLAAGLSMTE
jgi:hypothetical protein